MSGKKHHKHRPSYYLQARLERIDDREKKYDENLGRFVKRQGTNTPTVSWDEQEPGTETPTITIYGRKNVGDKHQNSGQERRN